MVGDFPSGGFDIGEDADKVVKGFSEKFIFRLAHGECVLIGL